jgi:hypothetical protein
MPACDTIKPAMVRHNRAAKLWNVVFKINQVLALLVRNDVVKVDIFIAPFKIVDYSLICKLFLNDE